MGKRNVKNKKDDNLLILNPDSSFQAKEDYRALRTNMLFSFVDSDSKVLAVTSSIRSEGKSTNSINIAISLAQMDKKVLLIDCDLRIPTIASKLGIHKEEGLSDVLVGKKTFKDSVIYNPDTRMHILTAGTLPPDPTKLLQSERMEKFIGKLKGLFDYIILDCPPLNAVVDALLMTEFVDGYLLLVKHNVTEIKDLSDSLKKIERANANLLGVIYTNAPREKHRAGVKGKYYYRK